MEQDLVSMFSGEGLEEECIKSMKEGSKDSSWYSSYINDSSSRVFLSVAMEWIML